MRVDRLTVVLLTLICSRYHVSGQTNQLVDICQTTQSQYTGGVSVSTPNYPNVDTNTDASCQCLITWASAAGRSNVTLSYTTWSFSGYTTSCWGWLDYQYDVSRSRSSCLSNTPSNPILNQYTTNGLLLRYSRQKTTIDRRGKFLLAVNVSPPQTYLIVSCASGSSMVYPTIRQESTSIPISYSASTSIPIRNPTPSPPILFGTPTPTPPISFSIPTSALSTSTTTSTTTTTTSTTTRTPTTTTTTTPTTTTTTPTTTYRPNNTVSASAIGGVKTTSVVNSTSVVNLTTLVRAAAPSVTTVNYGTTSKVNTTTQVPRTNPPSTQPTSYATPYVMVSSCNFIKRNNNSAPSGEYQIRTLSSGRTIQVYCEMGLNGGGYTFIQPFDWSSLSNADFQAMFQDRTSFLVRARKTDGTQPYGILKQLPTYSYSALNVGLNTNAPYTDPVNYASMGKPFMSFGFHPPNIPANNNIQGVQCNGVSITFNNCPYVSNSYIALFADFNESPEVTYSPTNVDFINQILTNLTSNPSGRVMPAEYFTFAEFLFGQGSCAHYTTTGRLRSTIGVLSVAIGIR